MKSLRHALWLVAPMLIFSGCGRVVLIQPGTVMPLAKPVRAEVFAPDDKGVLIQRSVELPAGTMVRTHADK